jgi:hypothetical protein
MNMCYIRQWPPKFHQHWTVCCDSDIETCLKWTRILYKLNFKESLNVENLCKFNLYKPNIFLYWIQNVVPTRFSITIEKHLIQYLVILIETVHKCSLCKHQVREPGTDGGKDRFKNPWYKYNVYCIIIYPNGRIFQFDFTKYWIKCFSIVITTQDLNVFLWFNRKQKQVLMFRKNEI